MKKARLCYFGDVECRNGHLVGCPVTEFSLDPENPWRDRTNPGHGASVPPALPDPDGLVSRWKLDQLGRWCMDA